MSIGMGLLRGAGRGLSSLGANRIAEEQKAAERQADQAIWEARQQRLQEMGLESFEKQQKIKDESTQKASEREYGQKKGLLSAKTDEDIRLVEELNKKGVDKTGKALKTGVMGDPSTKAKHQAELEAQNIPKDVARGIAYGTIKQIKDEYGMTTMLVDVAANNGKGATIGTIKETEDGGFEYEANPGWGGDAGSEKAPTMQAPQAAVDYLKQHPELKGQFKSKYGYLPEGY